MDAFITRLKQNTLLQVLTISLRYGLGSAFVYASVSKIEGVSPTAEPGDLAAVTTVSAVIEALLASGLYGQFVGWGQLWAGLLLMTQLFSTLGAVVFYPIMLNIFMITLSFDSASIALVTGLMLVANSYLLLWDWHKLKFIVLPSPQPYRDTTAKFSKRRSWAYLGLFYFVIIIWLRNAIISQQVVDPSRLAHPVLPVNVMVVVISMLLLWVITTVRQLMTR